MKRSVWLNGLLVALIVGVFVWSFTLPSDGPPEAGGDVGTAADAGAGNAAEDAFAPPEEAFWFVHVTGNESRELIDGEEPPPRTCPTAERFWIDTDNETLTVRYAHDKARITDNGVAVTYDVQEAWSECAVLHGVTVRPSAERELGRYGKFGLAVGADGTVTAPEGHTLLPGEDTRIEYTAEYQDGDARYRVAGWLQITHMGLWPIDQIQVDG